MLDVALARWIVAGAAGLALWSLSPVPSYAVGEAPAPPKRCSQYKEGGAAWKQCMGQKALIDDAEVYAVGYWLAKTGEHAAALDVLRSASLQSDPRIQTMIGFSLRKLGMVDEAIAYYAAALSADSSLTNARQYLGEAYLQKGERAKARDQLAQIGRLCGTSCEDYRLLSAAIAAAG